MPRRNAIPRNKREAEARIRALHALARARRGEPVLMAAREEHVTIQTMRRHLKGALRRRGRRWYVTRADREPRDMFVITALGPVSVSVRGSRAASLLGRHNAAVQQFLRKGEESVLAPFRGKRVAGHILITDPQLLSALADAGALRLEDLYSPAGAA